MSKFKVGDKVRCVRNDDFGLGFLTLDKEYEVIRFSKYGDVVIIADDGYEWGFYTDRFVLSETLQKSLDQPKYVLVEAKKDEFLQQVNELITKGYKPQGGVAVDQQYCIQAMILEN